MCWVLAELLFLTMLLLKWIILWTVEVSLLFICTCVVIVKTHVMDSTLASFTESLYMKSALSYHIWDKHREHFQDKLDNFRAGIVKSVSSAELDRVEYFYVVATKADTMGLNRYKVTV